MSIRNLQANSPGNEFLKRCRIQAALSQISRPQRLSVRCGVRFRPCIDIHKGKVKQIVGSTLKDSKEGDSSLITNYESDKSAAEYAKLYKDDQLMGGHVIMLGADPLSKSAAIEALHAYPGGLQVGGGINSSNALSYIDEGASHVIVTSYVFSDGQINFERLKELARVVGKHRLVLDLSCRKKEDEYAIVTDRWQKFSDVYLNESILNFLASYSDEFLVHGVDVEGKKLGIDEELVALLSRHSPIPVTYAGGVTVMADLERIKVAGMERVDVTVGQPSLRLSNLNIQAPWVKNQLRLKCFTKSGGSVIMFLFSFPHRSVPTWPHGLLPVSLEVLHAIELLESGLRMTKLKLMRRIIKLINILQTFG